MGLIISFMRRRFFNLEGRLLLLGLDAAGKTVSIRYLAMTCCADHPLQSAAWRSRLDHPHKCANWNRS